MANDLVSRQELKSIEVENCRLVSLDRGGRRDEVAPIGPQRPSLWGLRLKIAHVLGFPTRIPRSRSALKRGEDNEAEKGQSALCRARA